MGLDRSRNYDSVGENRVQNGVLTKRESRKRDRKSSTRSKGHVA